MGAGVAVRLGCAAWKIHQLGIPADPDQAKPHPTPEQGVVPGWRAGYVNRASTRLTLPSRSAKVHEGTQDAAGGGATDARQGHPTSKLCGHG